MKQRNWLTGVWIVGMIMFTIAMLLGPALFAQEITNPSDIVDGIKNATDWSQLVGMETAVYTLVFTIGGYLSAFIPGLRAIDTGAWRVLTWAILVIAGGLVIGWGSIWGGAIAYFFSTSLYEVVLKWFLPSPKPKQA